MSSEPIQSQVLPETADIISLLHQLDVHPRTRPETHDILSLLHQLYGSTPIVARPASPSSSVPAPAAAVITEEPTASPAAPTSVLDLSFDALFDSDPPASKSEPTTVTEPTSDVDAQNREDTTPRLSFDLSVRAFLNAIPWDASGRVERIAWATEPAEASEPASTPGQAAISTPQAGIDTAQPALSSSHALDLSVRAFMDAVPWDETSHVRSTSAQPAKPSTSQVECEDALSVVVTTAAPSPGVPTREQTLMDQSVQSFFAHVDWDRAPAQAPPSGKAATPPTAAAV